MKEINQDNYYDEVVVQPGIVVVDYYATWCAPCKILSKTLEELSSEHSEVKFVKVNIDENDKLVMQQQIQSVPTLDIFKNNVLLERMIGNQPKIKLKNILKEMLK